MTLCRSMWLSIAEGALATSMGTLLSGVFLTAFALALGANSVEIGILSALPLLANVAQIAGSWWLEAYGQRKWLCVGSLALSRLLWVPLLFIPLLSSSERSPGPIQTLIGLVAVSSFLSGMGAVAWLSWIRDLIPATMRVAFLARRHQFDTGCALGASIGAAMFADWWLAKWPGHHGGYVVIFGVAIVCGLVGIGLLSRIPDHHKLPRSTQTFISLLRAPLRERNFCLLLMFYISWCFFVNLAVPFFTVFMLQELGVPLWQVTTLQAASNVLALGAGGYWSRQSQMGGVKRVVAMATLGEAVLLSGWLVMGRETIWLLPLIYLAGIFGGPLATGANNLMLTIAPPKNASIYLGLFHALVGPGAALAPIAGGFLIKFSCGDWMFGDMSSLVGFKVVFLISVLGRIASLGLLLAVREPSAIPAATESSSSRSRHSKDVRHSHDSAILRAGREPGRGCGEAIQIR